MKPSWLVAGAVAVALGHSASAADKNAAPFNYRADLSSRKPRVCATCHPNQAKPHPDSDMAHALETVAECGILRDNPLLTFDANGYSYKIERQGDKSFYTVSKGNESITLPVGWALGLGAAGQTYVLEKDGNLYESLVSYYRNPGGLDITMGDQSLRPASLTEAIGRLMGDRERVGCFNCHATNAVKGQTLTLETMTAGVQCERCHGDAEQHLAGLKSGNAQMAAMKKLGAMSTEETNNFCGQCHRTWEQIAMNGPHGLLNVRFQPYRLTNSKCYDVDDKRISCTACHNPHKEIDRVSVNYDVKCGACHTVGGKPGARECKVGRKDCAGCHMPKLELPGAHHRFSDHDIRIVRADARYPE